MLSSVKSFRDIIMLSAAAAAAADNAVTYANLRQENRFSLLPAQCELKLLKSSYILKYYTEKLVFLRY